MIGAWITQTSSALSRTSAAARTPPATCRATTRALFTDILDDKIPSLRPGAILIALRIKGESLEELAGFPDACEAAYPHLIAATGTVSLVIPAYNGARQLPNLPHCC